jgi:hypothetical protein
MTAIDVRKWWRNSGRALAIIAIAVGLGAALWRANPQAQTFDSGSDGSDGALDVPGSLGTIDFEPRDTARWGRVLDADGDGVFNFTTIIIRGGTTLKMRADRIARPVYWLATGDVSIPGGGGIDLGGAAGTATNNLGSRRQLPVPGSGGFTGGAGGTGSVPATDGEGPGGGRASVILCNTGVRRCGAGGTYPGNRYLIALTGGSGGGGGVWDDGIYYGGGAGGGGILIASSTVITFGGGAFIAASGGPGNSGVGGGGSGGAIRLVAPTINAAGTLWVNGGGGSTVVSNGLTGVGGSGLIRIERFVQTGDFTINPNPSVATIGSPIDSATIKPAGQVRVTAIAGIPVTNPAGSFTVPDVSITAGAAVPVDIAATGIPPGTVVTLTVFPQTPSDVSIVNLPPVQITLTGTLAQSTGTVNFVFPYGFSRGVLHATWTQ